MKVYFTQLTNWSFTTSFMLYPEHSFESGGGLTYLQGIQSAYSKPCRQGKELFSRKLMHCYSLFISVLENTASLLMLFEHLVFWRKTLFHSMFISVLVNTTSVWIIFEHTSYCEKKLTFHSLFLSPLDIVSVLFEHTL